MSMNNLIPEKRATDWKGHKLSDRIINCRVMLAVHGFISHAEKRKIDRRIDKWMAMHGYSKKGTP